MLANLFESFRGFALLSDKLIVPMLKFKFSKLVRDKIIDHQVNSGAIPHYRPLSDKEHKQQLVEKIIEEAKEITQAKQEERASEIADVQQALDDLVERYGLTKKDIINAQKAKLNKNGAFKKEVFIDYVEIDESNKWVEYYKKNSERYPEIK